MKYKPGDIVQLRFEGDTGLAIVVEFSRYNTDGHECYWLKKKDGSAFTTTNRQNTIRNYNKEKSFWEGFFKPVLPIDPIRRAIDKAVEEISS